MKAILLTLGVLMVGVGVVFAQIYDRGVTRRHNLANPFMSQQKIVRPWEKWANPRASKQEIRPGRNVDNPAANQFGDGSSPNTYIPGKKKRDTYVPAKKKRDTHVPAKKKRKRDK